MSLSQEGEESPMSSVQTTPLTGMTAEQLSSIRGDDTRIEDNVAMFQSMLEKMLSNPRPP